MSWFLSTKVLIVFEVWIIRESGIISWWGCQWLHSWCCPWWIHPHTSEREPWFSCTSLIPTCTSILDPNTSTGEDLFFQWREFHVLPRTCQCVSEFDQVSCSAQNSVQCSLYWIYGRGCSSYSAIWGDLWVSEGQEEQKREAAIVVRGLSYGFPNGTGVSLAAALTWWGTKCQNKAGGIATTGTKRILDIAPKTIHERCSVFLGSKDDVQDLMKCYKEVAEDV